MSALDVVGFYRDLGYDLPRTGGEFVSVRCLLSPERHKHGDKSRSAGVSTSTGVHMCHVCGPTGPFSAAVKVLGSRKAAWDLCVRYGLARMTQEIQSGRTTNSFSGQHSVSCVTPRSEEKLLGLLDAYRRGESHADPVEHMLRDEASEFERELAGRIALLLGLLRGTTLLLSLRTALKVMGMEATDANITCVRRAFGRYDKWRTFEVGQARAISQARRGTTTFRALHSARPTDVSRHDNGGLRCDPNSRLSTARRDAGPSPSPARSTDACAAAISQVSACVTSTVDFRPTSTCGWPSDSIGTADSYTITSRPGLGSAWSEDERQALVDGVAV